MKRPVAYLRKSRVTSDRHVSWEVQLAAVNDLAARHGDPEPEVLSDWNKSGRKGAASRPGYARLLEMIEAGEVSALYSYSLSRLSRSLVDFSRLVAVCQESGVKIRLAKEEHLDFGSAAGRAMVNVLASFAQMEAELAQERARDTVAVRRARGDHIGGKEFEDTDTVVRAWRDAGSVQGAAKLLSLRGIPTRNGNAIWQTSSVKSILLRAAPDEFRVGEGRGIKRAAPFLFYRLLRCTCGKTLTGVRYASGKMAGYVSYRCLMGRVDPSHGPQSVPETVVLAWAQAEAALLRPPTDTIALAEDVGHKKEALLGRLDRLKRAWVDGLFEPEEYDRDRTEILAELEQLDAAGRVVTLEPISWDRDPKLVNGALRALWGHVQMDERQRPAFAEWTLPEWRATPEEQSGPEEPAARVA